MTNLLSNPALSGEQRSELLTIINEESDRLNRLVGEAAEVAQLDAHQVELHMAPHQLSEAVGIALEEVKNIVDKHPVEVADDEVAVR